MNDYHKISCEIHRGTANFGGPKCTCGLEDFISLKIAEATRWHKYPEERPPFYGDYWVYRKGCKKAHKQKWNNTGWAYDNNDTTHWRYLPENPKD